MLLSSVIAIVLFACLKCSYCRRFEDLLEGMFEKIHVCPLLVNTPLQCRLLAWQKDAASEGRHVHCDQTYIDIQFFCKDNEIVTADGLCTDPTGSLL